MRLNSLQSLRALKEIKGVPQIKPLIRTIVPIDKSKLSEIELLSHSASINLFAMRLLRYEISVTNRAEILAVTLKEIKKLNTILSKSDYYEETITRKEAKETFKRLGIKPRHITI